MARILLAPTTAKPPFYAGLEATHPLARGLVYAQINNEPSRAAGTGVQVTNLVSPAQVFRSTTSVATDQLFVGGPTGQVLKVNGNNNGAGNGTGGLVGPGLFTGQPSLTIAVRWYLDALSIHAGSFVKIGDANGVGFGIGNADMDTVGNNYLVLYENIKWIPLGVTVQTGWHTAVCVIYGNVNATIDLWVDGTRTTASGAGGYGVVGAAESTYIGRGAANRNLTHLQDYLYVWNRILADNEIRAIARAPYQILQATSPLRFGLLPFSGLVFSGADLLAPADAQAGALAAGLGDPIAPADSPALLAALAGADPLVGLDSPAGSLLAGPTDPLAGQDLAAAALASLLADPLVPAEALAGLAGVAGADATAPADALAGALALAGSDPLAGSDTLAGLLSLVGADSLSPADLATLFLNAGIALTILDALAPADAAALLAGLLAPDASGAQDAAALLAAAAILDATAPADAAQAILFSGLVLAILDPLVSADTLAAVASLAATDPLAPADLAALALAGAIAVSVPDPLLPQDTLAAVAGLLAPDAAIPADGLAGLLSQIGADALAGSDLASFLGGGNLFIGLLDPLVPQDAASLAALVAAADPGAPQDTLAAAFVAQPSAVLYDPLVPQDSAAGTLGLAGADPLLAADAAALYAADAAWRGSGRGKVLLIPIGPRVLVLRDPSAPR